jgi:hypothetical protein
METFLDFKVSKRNYFLQTIHAKVGSYWLAVGMQERRLYRFIHNKTANRLLLTANRIVTFAKNQIT